MGVVWVWHSVPEVRFEKLATMSLDTSAVVTKTNFCGGLESTAVSIS